MSPCDDIFYIVIFLQGVGGGMSKLMSVLHQNAATLVNSKSELNGPDQVCNIEFSHHTGKNKGYLWLGADSHRFLHM